VSRGDLRGGVQGLAVMMTLAVAGAGCKGRDAGPATTTAKRRIVSVGGAVTETVFALGAGADVIAVDSSSVAPYDVVSKLPQVGYQRTLAAEPIAAMEPTLVIATDEAGPPAALTQLRELGLRLVTIKGGHTVEAARARIQGIATELGADPTALLATFDRDVAAARALAGKPHRRVKAISVYSRGAGVVMAGGIDTASGAMLALAGADNAIDVTGYAPLTSEALVAAAPEVIVIPTRGLATLGGEAALWELPGMAQTPAGRDRKLVAIDDLLLLGFGPRLGEGIRQLTIGLYPGVVATAP
jgi:iron complex transport system substrate-binding protein